MNDIREEIIETESSIRKLNEALSQTTLKSAQLNKVIALLEQNRTEFLEDRNSLAGMDADLRAAAQQVNDAHERLKDTHQNNAATAAALRSAMSELGEELARVARRVDQANSQLLENTARVSRVMEELEGQRLRALERETVRQNDQKALMSRLTLIVTFSLLSLAALIALVFTSF
jgi:chromosome segregation ATPase